MEIIGLPLTIGLVIAGIAIGTFFIIRRFRRRGNHQVLQEDEIELQVYKLKSLQDDEISPRRSPPIIDDLSVGANPIIRSVKIIQS